MRWLKIHQNTEEQYPRETILKLFTIYLLLFFSPFLLVIYNTVGFYGI